MRQLWHAARRAGHEWGRGQVGRLMGLADIDGVRRGRHATTATTRETSAPRHPDLIDRAGRPRPARTSGGSRTSLRLDAGRGRLRLLRHRRARLCSQQRIWSIFARKRGLTRKAGPPVHDDLVDRVFTATAPNAVWLTDITEHPTAEGKLYLCAIKDLHSGRIVGYSMDARMTASLAVSALRNAIALRSPAGTRDCCSFG